MIWTYSVQEHCRNEYIWNLLHIYLTVPYAMSIRQQKPRGAIILRGINFVYVIIIDPGTVSF